jgi:hypothetical protein
MLCLNLCKICVEFEQFFSGHKAFNFATDSPICVTRTVSASYFTAQCYSTHTVSRCILLVLRADFCSEHGHVIGVT